MDVAGLDRILEICLRVLNVLTFCLFTLYWKHPLPWGKFHGLPTYWFTKFQESKIDPGMSLTVFTLLMEAPAIIYPILVFPYGRHASNPKAWLLMAPYIIHYIHRGLLYAVLVNSKHTHKIYIWFLPVGLYVTFTIALSQAREISHYHDYDNDTWFWFRVPVGLFLFFWGFWVKVCSDQTLSGLKRNDGIYKIPTGGWFELVSNAHYLGELTEWIGWLIMTQSISFISCYLYSCSLLLPRALANHRFYLKNFKNYPKTRKILIPYLI